MSVTRIIGLTGGIATGKSTVADYLAERYQLPILDADLYARDAVAVGSPILARIVERYGVGIQNGDGSLNRVALGNIVFQDAEEKRWLEAQIHPYVRERFHQQLNLLTQSSQGDRPQSATPIIVCVIPLLIEAQLTHLVSEIWVVSCGFAQQLARLQHRNQLTIEQAQARIQSQMPLAEKVKFADVVLDNSGALPKLYAQIDQALSENPPTPR